MKHYYTFTLNANSNLQKISLEFPLSSIELSELHIYTKDGTLVKKPLDILKELSLEISSCDSITSLKNVTNISISHMINNNCKGCCMLNYKIPYNRISVNEKNYPVKNYFSFTIPERELIKEFDFEFTCQIQKVQSDINNVNQSSNVAELIILC